MSTAPLTPATSRKPRGHLTVRTGGARAALTALMPVLGGAAAAGALGAAHGGYFPTSWGWAALASCWVAAIALAVRPVISISGLEVAFLGTLGGLLAWTAMSISWSSGAAQPVAELQRGLIYLTAVGAAIVVLQRGSTVQLAVGLLAGITAVAADGLAARRVPQRLGTYDPMAAYRLFAPIGYWNALGILAAMGALLAVGFATRGRSTPGRAAAASTLVVLMPTLYFTFGRGAWLALACGLAAMLAVETHRLRLLATLPVIALGPAAAVFVGARSATLTQLGSPPAATSSEGRRLALLIVVAAALQVALVFALAAVQHRVAVGSKARRRGGLAVAVGCAAAAGALFAFYGTPWTLAARGYHQFTGYSTATNLNDRLFDIGGNGRIDLWHAAWRDAGSHPLLGSGAGSYGEYWYVHRANPANNVQDAHSLYLETFAELGAVGLALLLAALTIPLVGFARIRTATLAPALLATYVAYLVHAAADWDWEMPVVTLSALLCGTAMLTLGRAAPGGRRLSLRPRLCLIGLVLVPAAFAFMTVMGESALTASRDALAAGNAARASSEARTAGRWLPWAAEPWRRLAEARIAAGDTPGAVAAYRTAVSRDPGNWELWFDYAYADPQRVNAVALARARALNPLNPQLAP